MSGSDSDKPLGRLPAIAESQNVAEEQLLCAALDGKASALQGLKPEHFQSSVNRAIYEAIADLLKSGGSIGPLELLRALEKSARLDSEVGRKEIEDLAAGYVPPGQIQPARDILIRNYQQQRLVGLTKSMLQSLESGQAESLDELDTHIAALEEDYRREAPARAGLGSAIIDADAFLRMELPRKEAILFPWLSEQTITLISGDRGVGKSWFAMAIVDAVTRGKAFGPWPCKKAVACCYLEGEMPAQDVRNRFLQLNPEGAERAEQLFIYSDAHANALGISRANLLCEVWRSEIKRVLIERGVKLFIIDNLASLTVGIDENSKKDWDPINAWLLELRFAEISAIMLHHTGKGGQQRGTSAREDNIDSSILLKAPASCEPGEGARFTASFTKRRVSGEGLKAITDTEFRLTQDEAGRVEWSFGNVKLERKLEILRMLDAEYAPGDIVDELRVTKGYVSQVKKQAIKDGHLCAKGKLTQAGFVVMPGAKND